MSCSRVRFHRDLLTLPALLLAAASVSAQSPPKPRFYPDDPVCCAVRPKNVPEMKARETDALFDFIYQSFAPPPKQVTPARGVNTLGEVLDSEWYSNRHGKSRMTREQLQAGPSRPGDAPRPPFEVVGGKLDGVTPGFRMRDAADRLYFVKVDPISDPEMATAADPIGTRFFYALGYNTPEYFIVHAKESDLTIGKKGEIRGANGKMRPMRPRDIKKVLWKVPRNKDGSFRLVASLAIPGKTIGPFRYKGVRSDDPNDVIPHEDRRDLRGLQVFCAWLNHTDAKATNTMDSLVQENGVSFVKHFLMDFGAIMGSDSDMAKNARFGNAYIFPTGRQARNDMLSFGLNPKPWETAKTPHIRGVGRFQAQSFDPETWVSNFPNPAFLKRTPEDEYWAAKQVMAFSDEDIRLIVETGQYSDPRAADYIAKTLIERRNRIGRAYFTKVLALDSFRIENGRLAFDDLAAKHNFLPPRTYAISWNRFDNQAGRLDPIAGAASAALPPETASASSGSYFAARINATPESPKTVTVYLRKSAAGRFEVVGIDRTW